MEAKNYRQWRGRYLKSYFPLLIISLVITLGLVGLQLLSPVPIKILVDNVFGDQQLTWGPEANNGKELLAFVAVIFVAIAVVRELYTVFQQYMFRLFSQIIDRKIMQDIFASVNKIPEGSPERLKSGEYVLAVSNQSQQMSQLILVNVVTIIGSVITIAAILFLMRRIDTGLMLAAMLVFPPATALVYFLGRKIDDVSDLTEKTHSQVFQFINESIQKLRLIQLFALTKQQIKRLTSLVSIRNKHARKQTALLSVLSGTDEVVLAIATAAIIYIGGNGVFDGDVTLGDLFLFIAYLDFLYQPFALIVDAIGSSKEQNAALKRVFDVVKTSEGLALQSGENDASGLKGMLEFKNLEIKYGSKSIIQPTNIKIEPGQLVAIIGSSGSGKSTLLDAIDRFVPIFSGQLLLDGKDVRDYHLDSLRENIAYVDQSSDMLELSISDNISLHDMERKNKLPDVMKGAIFGDLVDFAEAVPNKYDYILDDINLSGGQKQRINLARAYYKNAQIVLMDEPTSALDKVSAERIRANIQKYLPGRTQIMVTHDLDLVQMADRVLLVKSGNVTEVTGHTNYKEMLE